MKALLIGLLSLYGCGSPSVEAQARTPVTATSKKLEWPKTTAPDKTDPYWEINNNLNNNGTEYRKVEVSPDHWEWQVDKAAMEAGARYEQQRRDLYWALRSRVLTDDEMAEVTRYGDGLNVEPMVPYRPADKAIELNDALLQQFRLRQGVKP